MKKKKNTERNTKRSHGSMRTDAFNLTALLHNLKVLFLPWLLVSILTAVLIISSNIFFSNEVDSVSSTISFYYKGVENGLDPNGCEIDKNSIKNDKVVLEALKEMNLSEDLLDTVESGIFIDSIASNNAINDIVNYKSIYNSDSSNWMESMKNSAYHPTSYRVSFNYSKTPLSGSEAAELLNLILEKYRFYFFETYGYNDSVGESVMSVDFNNYDYLIALDMFNSKLNSLENYINTLSEDDKTHFRSEETGYSFSDLKNSISLIRSVDIDTLTSYILNNGVISDKNMILSYYDFRLENLKRQKQSTTERLNSTISSINNYQKDSIVVYEGSASNETSITETSEVYDNLIQEKIQLQDSVSSYDSIIADYTDRINSINKPSNNISDAKKKYVESKISDLTEKSIALINDIKITANDYYSTVKFANAVSVTSPASYSFSQYIKTVLDESIRMLIISELTLMTLYLFVSIIVCLKYKMNTILRNHMAK